MVKEQNILQIADDVRSRLAAKCNERHIDIQLESRDCRLEDDWPYLCVTTPAPGAKAVDYAETLGDIEKDLREAGIDNVLLVPALAG